MSALVHDRRVAGFRALYDKAGLPASAYPAFREAVEAMREGGFIGEPGGATRLKRRMVERVLTRCAEERGRHRAAADLLRRFAAEAAREEARMFCDELVADAMHQCRPSSDFAAGAAARAALRLVHRGTIDGAL